MIVIVFTIYFCLHFPKFWKKFPSDGDTTERRDRTISYAHILEESEESPALTYDPYCLDNPEMKSMHKTDINLPCMIISFLEFKTPESLKRDGNEQFKEKWPEIDITLSKIRSIKRDLLKVANSIHLPVYVLCFAYVYFETLAFSLYINKANRKIVAGACLMIASKFLHVKIALLEVLAEVSADIFKSFKLLNLNTNIHFLNFVKQELQIWYATVKYQPAKQG